MPPISLQIAPEIGNAIATGAPVVALESTLVAHGLPWPDNLELARQAEDMVRAHGAVPATIAVLAGRAHIGLSAVELERLASEGPSIEKSGAQDLAVYMARGQDAATTVSGTAFLAARAGISFFATGGIGGVHRGADADVSHDLVALARWPVVVVSAGAKAILDLPRTLETLETLGVLVVGYGTHDMPGFYVRETGLRLPHRVDDPHQVARMARMRFALDQGGVLLCNPLPIDSALDPAWIHAQIESALADAAEQRIVGKALTPFLLASLAKSTKGLSIRANRALVLSNCAVAAESARAFTEAT